MTKKINIDSDINNLRIVEKAIDEITNEYKISQENYGKILVSALEAVNNAIIHGNKSIKEKVVFIEISLTKNSFIFSVEDEGKGFNPSKIPDPTKPENIEKINGRGIFLMTKLADEIEFNDKGNRVKMTFKLG